VLLGDNTGEASKQLLCDALRVQSLDAGNSDGGCGCGTAGGGAAAGGAALVLGLVLRRRRR